MSKLPSSAVQFDSSKSAPTEQMFGPASDLPTRQDPSFFVPGLYADTFGLDTVTERTSKAKTGHTYRTLPGWSTLSQTTRDLPTIDEAGDPLDPSTWGVTTKVKTVHFRAYDATDTLADVLGADPEDIAHASLPDSDSRADREFETEALDYWQGAMSADVFTLRTPYTDLATVDVATVLHHTPSRMSEATGRVVGGRPYWTVDSDNLLIVAGDNVFQWAVSAVIRPVSKGRTLRVASAFKPVTKDAPASAVRA